MTDFLFKVEYTTAGSTDLTITFPYLLEENVLVLRGAAGQPVGEEVYIVENRPNDWDFLDTSTVRLVTPIAAGESIWILRQTKIDKRLVDYADGAMLPATDLNMVTKQLLYLIQEVGEAKVSGLNIGGGGGVGSGGGTITEAEIDQIITELLSRQTFLNLIDLIPLVDVNAELIIADTLKNHRDWLIDGNFDFKLGSTDARVTIVENTQVTDASSLASYKVQTAARFDNNEASITTLQTAESTQGSAIATLQTDVVARVPYADLENQIALSSYVNGVKATADGNGADISGITSYLVGIGDFTNPLSDGLSNLPYRMSLMQTTVDGNASDISTEITWRQSLASYFGYGGDIDSGSSFAAAMKSVWETYADSGSAVATRVTTLEANSTPIFFRTATPDPTNVEFSGTGWDVAGFPRGAIWNRIYSAVKIRPYVWLMTNPGHAEQVAIANGWWLPATDDDLEGTMGARVDTVEDAVVGPGGAIASLTTRLQAVYGANIANVEEWLDAYIKPPTDPLDPSTGGIMYSGYGVRANQYLGDNTPVIAGFAFGLQSDPWNPDAGSVSDFIVMADNFAVIAPPSTGTDLTGVLDANDIIVPFIIDTASQQVVVNGDLFVRGTLKAYEGGMLDISTGRIEVGQMDTDIELANPTGMRMGLYSSTNNYWTSNTASPFPSGANPQKFLAWAGTGTMNHNNAIFYVDTDGNAMFAGEVAADNIVGDLNSAIALSVHPLSNQTANSTTNPVWLTNNGGVSVFSTGGGNTRGRKPFASVSISMFGSGQTEGRARMEMRLETSPSVYGAWTNVAESAIAIPTGSTLTLSGGLPTATDFGAQLRVGILRENGQSPQSNGYNGMFLMLT